MNVMRRVAAAVGVPWMNRAAAEAAPAAARAGSASGSVARDRLSIILSSQRVKNVDLKALQADIVDIIKVRRTRAAARRAHTAHRPPLSARLPLQKHMRVEDVAPVNVSVKKANGVDVFEMQVALAAATQTGAGAAGAAGAGAAAPRAL